MKTTKVESDVKPPLRRSTRVVDKPLSYYSEGEEKEEEEKEKEEQDEAEEEVALEAKIKKVQKAAESSYEKVRQQRLYENKKRMQQLSLPLLSQALKPSKRPYIKKTKVEMDVKPAPRKSSRVVDKPLSYYEEEEEEEEEAEQDEAEEEKEEQDEAAKEEQEKEEQDEAEEVAVEAKIKKVQKARESSYEKLRQQRLGENKKRMQQLNLPLLSQALKPSKRPYIKKTKVELDVKPAPRRSTRVADKPLSYYSEEEEEEEEQEEEEYAEELTVEAKTKKEVEELTVEAKKPKTKKRKKREQFKRHDYSDKKILHAIVRAEKLELSLGFEFPTFIIPLRRYHMNRLVIPTLFRKHYPGDHDKMVTLIDEDGNELQTQYVARYNGFYSGWKAFKDHHNLVEGDALVFQLIKPTTFKVYIIRKNVSEEDEKHGLEDS